MNEVWNGPKTSKDQFKNNLNFQGGMLLEEQTVQSVDLEVQPEEVEEEKENIAQTSEKIPMEEEDQYKFENFLDIMEIF